MVGTVSARMRLAGTRSIAFGASAIAIAAASPAFAQSAQCVTDATGICTLTNSGTVGQFAVPNGGKISIVNNSGTISGDPAILQADGNTPGAQTNRSVVIINNLAGGTIQGTDGDAIISSSNNSLIIIPTPGAIVAPDLQPAWGITISNAGTIEGNVVVSGAVTRNIYRSLGGTVDGNVDLSSQGNNSATFLFDGLTTGVTGSITAGAGIDYYGRSFGTSGTALLGGPLPTSFEKDAVDVRGTDTTVTLLPAVGVTGPIASVQLSGDGNIVNRANVTGTPASAETNNVPIAAITHVGVVDKISGFITFMRLPNNPAQGVFGGASLGFGLNSFTNEGAISGDVALTTASFTNNATMTSNVATPGTTITANNSGPFTFLNSATGTIALTGTGTRPAQISAFGLPTAAVTIRSPIGFPNPPANPYTITNDGSLDGIAAFVTASTLDFSNSGTINGFGGHDAVRLDIGADPYRFTSTLDAQRVTIVNSGTVNGDFDVEGGIDNFSFSNSGSIIVDAESTALEFDIDPIREEDADGNDIDGATFTFENTGRIDGVSANIAFATSTFTNSGAINRTGDAGQAFGIESYTDNGQVIAFTNAAGGSITHAGGGDEPGIAFALDAEAGFDDDEEIGNPNANIAVTFNNAGTIRADGGGIEVDGETFGGAPGSVFILPAAAVALITDAANTSTIAVNNQAGGLISATGDNSAALLAVGDTVSIVNDGTIAGGSGVALSDTRMLFIDGEVPELPPGTTQVAGAIQTLGSTDLIRNNEGGTITGSIDLNSGNDRIENYGSIIGDVSLGDGDDTFVQGIRAIFSGTADGGAGNDTFNIDTTGGGRIEEGLMERFINFETFALIGDGTVEIDSGAGDDSFDNQGTVSDANLGEGNNSFSNQGTVQGNVTSGAGSDNVSNAGTIGGSIDVGDGDNQVANSGTVMGDIIAGDGANSIQNASGASVAGNVTLGNGANMVQNAGTIGGSVTTGSAADIVTNTGAIGGDVDLGGGNDKLVIAPGSSIGGIASGGEGIDTVSASFAGTDAAPTEVDMSGFTDFETFEATGGTAAISGTTTYQTVQVDGGRIIGRAGSTITASQVMVGSNATFGSAGMVVGNVRIGSGGTLSPGASPGTMTVQGNVTIDSGTTTLFELTPTVSDKLIVSGTLTVGSNATLKLTGNRPLTPGVTLDLITAGTLTGTFLIAQDPTIGGFVLQGGNKVQLLGQFATPAGVNAQTAAAIAYVNDTLVAGQSAALLAAIPQLLNGDGTTRTASFAQLTPEAYASATQLGVEHGLAYAKAGRAGGMATTREENGLFSFAQALGDWRTLRGSNTIGTSRAKNRSYGLLGGIGIGSKAASIGAFVGYLDSQQRINRLGARTTANSVVAGLAGHFTSDLFELNGLVAYDWANARTRRSVPGSTARGKYDLNNLVVDVSAGFRYGVGTGWSLRPEVGITHISTRRGGATETGGGAFGLVVDRERSSATFIDGGIALEGGREDGATLHPWVRAGVRHQFDGEQSDATAGFIGTTTRFTVLGVARNKTLATVGAGVSADLAPGMSLYAAYQGEFGSGSSSNANVGIRFAF